MECHPHFPSKLHTFNIVVMMLFTVIINLIQLMHLHCLLIVFSLLLLSCCHCSLTLTFFIIVICFCCTPPHHIVINVIDCCCCFSAAAIIFHHKIGTFAEFSMSTSLHCCFYARSCATGLVKTLNDFSCTIFFALSNECTLISQALAT